MSSENVIHQLIQQLDEQQALIIKMQKDLEKIKGWVSIQEAIFKDRRKWVYPPQFDDTTQNQAAFNSLVNQLKEN